MLHRAGPNAIYGGGEGGGGPTTGDTTGGSGGLLAASWAAISLLTADNSSKTQKWLDFDA